MTDAVTIGRWEWLLRSLLPVAFIPLAMLDRRGAAIAVVILTTYLAVTERLIYWQRRTIETKVELMTDPVTITIPADLADQIRANVAYWESDESGGWVDVPPYSNADLIYQIFLALPEPEWEPTHAQVTAMVIVPGHGITSRSWATDRLKSLHKAGFDLTLREAETDD